MILVGTSIWIDHLNLGDERLTELLDQGFVVTHPVVVGEISLGSIRRRTDVLSLLDDLPTAWRATHDEVRILVEEHSLWGRGLEFGDAHLLASALITPGCKLWTRDKRLQSAASELAIDAARGLT